MSQRKSCHTKKLLCLFQSLFIFPFSSSSSSYSFSRWNTLAVVQGGKTEKCQFGYVDVEKYAAELALALAWGKKNKTEFSASQFHFFTWFTTEASTTTKYNMNKEKKMTWEFYEEQVRACLPGYDIITRWHAILPLQHQQYSSLNNNSNELSIYHSVFLPGLFIIHFLRTFFSVRRCCCRKLKLSGRHWCYFRGYSGFVGMQG